MAKQTRSTKGYGAVVLIAAALAETAHAPLRSHASASVKKSNARPAIAQLKQAAPDQMHKPKQTLEIPPTPLAIASIEPKDRLKFEPKKPDPFHPFPDTPGLNLPSGSNTPSKAISLLHTSDTDNSGTDLTIASLGNPTAQSDAEIAAPSFLNGESTIVSLDGPIIFNPRDPAIPVSPGSGTGASGTINTAIPEPGTISILLSGAIALGYRRGRKIAA